MYVTPPIFKIAQTEGIYRGQIKIGKNDINIIDLYPYDVTFVNKYQSRCIMGLNGGNLLPYCC